MLGRMLMAVLVLAPQPAVAAHVRSIAPQRTASTPATAGAGAGSGAVLSTLLSPIPSADFKMPAISVPLMPQFAASRHIPKTPESVNPQGAPALAQPKPTSSSDFGAIIPAFHPAQPLRRFSPDDSTAPTEHRKDETIHSPRIASAARAPHSIGLKALGSVPKYEAAPSLAAFFDQSRLGRPAVNEGPLVSARPSIAANLLSKDGGSSPGPSFEPPQPAKSTGLGASAVYYTLYLSLLQAGLGVYTPIWPGLAMERFGTANYGLASSLAVLSMPVAAYLGKWLGARLGVKHGLAASLLGTAAALTFLFGAFGLQALSWGGLLAGLIAVQGLFALMRTLDRGVPTALYGRDQKKLQTFNGLTFAVSRIPGILVPMAVGGLVGSLGSFGALSLFPIALLAAIPFILLMKTRGAPASGPPEKIGEGDARLLHLAGIGFASQQIMTYVVPFIVASAWGTFANPGDALAAKSAAGILMGFWTLGTLLGTLHLLGLFRWLSGKLGLAIPAGNPGRKLRMGAILGAFGFVGYFPLMLTIPWAAYLAMIPAGFAGAYSFLLYLSAAQASAPADRSGVVARYMIYSFAVVAAAVWGIAALIQAFPGSFIPFAALSAGLALLGAANFYIYKKLP